MAVIDKIGSIRSLLRWGSINCERVPPKSRRTIDKDRERWLAKYVHSSLCF
jgi:hypothetical protein